MDLGDYIVTAVFIALAVSLIANTLQYTVYTTPRFEAPQQKYSCVVGIVYEEKWVELTSTMRVLGRVPMSYTIVALDNQICYTDACGYFSFTTVELGTHELRIEMKGYYTEYRVVHAYYLEYIQVEMKQK